MQCTVLMNINCTLRDFLLGQYLEGFTSSKSLPELKIDWKRHYLEGISQKVCKQEVKNTLYYFFFLMSHERTVCSCFILGKRFIVLTFHHLRIRFTLIQLLERPGIELSIKECSILLCLSIFIFQFQMNHKKNPESNLLEISRWNSAQPRSCKAFGLNHIRSQKKTVSRASSGANQDGKQLPSIYSLQI